MAFHNGESIAIFSAIMYRVCIKRTKEAEITRDLGRFAFRKIAHSKLILNERDGYTERTQIFFPNIPFI